MCYFVTSISFCRGLAKSSRELLVVVFVWVLMWLISVQLWRRLHYSVTVLAPWAFRRSYDASAACRNDGDESSQCMLLVVTSPVHDLMMGVVTSSSQPNTCDFRHSTSFRTTKYRQTLDRWLRTDTIESYHCRFFWIHLFLIFVFQLLFLLFFFVPRAID